MPRTHFISRILLSAILSIFAVARPLFVAGAANEPPWLELHSAHFTVITDAGEKRGREVAFRFEQMRAVFGQLLGRNRLQQSIPLTIYAFKSDKSYYQAAPLYNGQPIGAPGFFLAGADQDIIVLNLFEPDPWSAVAHDFAIMLLNYNYPPAQGWFDEGMAEYFASIRLDNKQVELGGDPELAPSTREDLLGNSHDTNPAKSLTELLGVQVWLPLPDLFEQKHDTSTRNEGTHHTLYYAESWMVMHYLLHTSRLPETGNYFDLVLNRHVPVQGAIQQAYGMSADQLEQAVKDYFKKQDVLGRAVEVARQGPSGGAPAPSAETDTIPSPISIDDTAIDVKPLPEAEARAQYAGIQIRLPDRREVGLKTLQELAETPTDADKKAQTIQETKTKKLGDDPEQLPTHAVGNAVAHRILAYDHIQHNEFEQAFSEINDAAALNPRDPWIRYYFSLAKYDMAQVKHSEIMGLANMILDLKAVLEWNPEMASAYDLLALARNAGGGPTAAMQSEHAAINLSPRNELYQYHLAQIYLAAKKWDAGNLLLDRLKTSSNPEIAKLARDLQTQAGAERKYGIALNSTGAPPPKFEKQKSPFDILEEDAAKRAAAEQSTDDSGVACDTRPTRFLKGTLVAVDCSSAPAAMMTLKTEGSSLKLHVVDFRSVLLIGTDTFSCDWHNLPVSVNYKAGGLADGDVVSLEVLK